MTDGTTEFGDLSHVKLPISVPRFCLVVDDSSTIRKVIVRLLKEMNFVVGEAETGVVALEACKLVVPELILLDWNMPEMDGITCLRALRAQNFEPRPLIVMCTTENVLPKITEALEAGADEYIMKPFDADVLRDKLAQLALV
jgi:two-component system chemotaxis response regulator CheY